MRPFAAACLAACAALSAHAATPVAVWDGDFTKTVAGYPLNANGNPIADGTITISDDASKGVTVGFDTGFTSFTVLFKYANLDLAATTDQVLTTVNGNAQNDRVGTRLKNDDKTVRGIWQGANWDNVTGATLDETDTAGVFAMTYNRTGGTYLYRIVSGLREQVYAAPSLKMDKDSTLVGVTIGGPYSCALPVAAGLKIAGIAIFNGVLTESEMLAYKWPSELSKPVYLINFYHQNTSPTAGWANWTQTGGAVMPNAGQGTGTVTTNGISFVTDDLGGNFRNDVVGVCSGDFSAGTYVDIYGNSHASLLDEVKASLNVDVDISVPLKTGMANGAKAGNTATISGLTADKKYVAYFGYGTYGTGDDTSGFKLPSGGYGDLERLEYVVTGAGTTGDIPTVLATSYTSFEAGKTIRPGKRNMMLVRAVLTPTSNGQIKFVLAGLRSVVSFVAIAEMPAATKYTASFSTDSRWSELVWDPPEPEGGFEADAIFEVVNTAPAKLTMDESLTAKSVNIVNAAGAAMTLAVGSESFAAGFDCSGAAGGVTIDARDVDGSALADNSVVGAPYPSWLFTGKVTGTPSVVCPNVPTGYAIASEVLPEYGVRLVVTAPESAQIDAISVNLYRANPLGSGTSGLYPVDRSLWTNLTVGANASITFSGVTFTCSANAKSWAYDTGYGDIIYRDYMDDTTGATKSLAIADIPYPKYRIIVYFNSDDSNADRPFYPMTANGVSYAGPYSDGTASCTVKGATANWGRNGSRGTPAEGNNALVTDVMTSRNVTLGFASGDRSIARATPCALQIVKLGSAVDVRNYSVELSGDKALSETEWTPPKMTAFTSDDWLTITNTATRATFTLDEDITVGKMTVVSAAGKMLVIKKNPDVATDFGALDFSRAVEGVGFDARESDFTACQTLLDYARTHNEKFTFFGEGENGALLDYGTTYNNYTFAGHYVFDGGTHTFQNASEGTGVHYFGANATAENPTLWVKDDTTLYFKSRNPCGWSTYTNTAGVVRIGNGARVVAENSVAGTWYWSQQFYLDPGATLEIATTVDKFRLNGGCGGDAPQIVMPASDGGTAEIVSTAATNNLCIGDNAYSAVAVKVGAGSTLTISAAMKTLAAGKAFGKYGEGTLKLTGDLSAFVPAYRIADGTIDFANGKTNRVSNALVNEGTILVSDGVVAFMDFADGTMPGNVVTSGTGRWYYGYTVSINDMGRFRIPAGRTWDEMMIFDEGGTPLPITSHDANYVYFDWKITDDACWWDYEFEGNVNNAGTEGTALKWDGNRPFKNNEYATDETTGEMSLHVPARPYREVSGWPTAATFVMYGTMVKDADRYYVVFGSTRYGTKNTVFLATDDIDNGKVVLCRANDLGESATVTKLCTMTVPNATDAKHLYAFVLKSDGAQTVIDIYLDGQMLQTYSFGSIVTLGTGFQIASPHGDPVKGYDRPADDDPALLDWLRVYDTELSPVAMAEYAKRYPYVSVNGKATRTFSGNSTWTLGDAWTQTPYQGEPYPTNRPSAKSMVAISATVESEVTFDLDEAANYESLDVLAGSPMALRTGGAVKPSVTGFTTVGADLTVDYDAIALSGPVSVLANKTLTFDFRSLDVSSQWMSVTNALTGMVTLGEGARVVATNLVQAAGRTAEFVQNASTGQYELRITMTGMLEADLSGNANFGNLVWRIGTEVVRPDWTKKVAGTIHVKADNPTLTFASALASDNSKLLFDSSNRVTLAACGSVTGLSYDFTGLGENKVTFKYNPDPATVVAAQYVRYDVDMGVYMYNDVLRIANAFYEFKKIRIDGNGYDYHDRTVIVQKGDYLNLHDGSNLGCGLSLDVRGGEVHMGTLIDSGNISYGWNGTRFNQSGGTVVVHANGKTQTGYVGFVLSHSSGGGGCHEFNVTGGTFSVPESSICFNQPSNTINVGGAGVVRAKGAFFSGVAKAVAGTVNVSTGGVFEVGSLGVTATAMKAFNLNGGTLRGFEAGAAFASPVALVGDSTVETADGTALTLSGAVAGSGTLTLAKGTVKIGKASCLGTSAFAVASGATLDINGFAPGGALTVSGAGVGGAGVLVNTGADAQFVANLTLADDATVGGASLIGFNQGSAINLAGHTLTLSGTGLTVKLDGFTVNGGGAVAVEKGVLASRRSTNMDGTDLAVGGSGTLDLSSGASISCRDFASPKGKIVGTNATLIVNGTLNASSRISVPKLNLKGTATLKSTGLSVTDSLTLGTALNVEVANVSEGLQIATVPRGTDISRTAVVVNGSDDYQLYITDNTKLRIKTKGSMSADVVISVAPEDHGVNFESVTVDGKVDVHDSGASKTGVTNITITARASDGTTVISHTYEYAGGGETGDFSYEFSGLEAGESYVFSAEVEVVGSKVTTTGSDIDVVAARSIEPTPYGSDGWIYEDAKTFAGVEPGTGVWYGTNGVAYASASNEVIRLYAEDWTRNAEFQPAHMNLDLEYSCVKDLHFHVMFDCPGFFTYEPHPIVQDGVSAAFTLVADDNDDSYLAVVSGGEWEIVSRDVFAPEIGVWYDVLVRLDGVASNIQYSVISDSGVTRLATSPAKEGSRDVSLDLAGSGDVELIEGIGQNAHLAQVGDEQFWTIGEAIEESGNTGEAVVPLWWSYYMVDGDGGAFRLCNTNDYLKLGWRKWHHWGVEDDVYRWISGNNWIEYADSNGVAQVNGDWLVTNEFGLAWIAEQATNQWFCGDVSISTNLDLSSKNWTPIAQFMGSFDGRGYTIKGLNNSHVIYTNLLGAAGYYFGGPTNDWSYTAYGLFGSATNASFANVAFEDVAISNVADSAAVLLGVHAGGDLSIRNVEVVSGRVQGEGRAVAGIVTVGGNEELLGDIVIAGNTNRATIAGTIGDGLDGGNVAQILAGTSWDAVFEGNVVATNNVGEGEFDVRVVYDLDVPETNDWYESWYSWLDLPVCNFAPAVVRTDENLDFWRFVEANDPASIPIDPLYRTARMLAGKFFNGEDNFSGWWMDTITAGGTGTVVTITGTNNTLDVWTTVFVDRDVTIDLNTNCVYGLYDCDVFSVAPGKKLTLRNGVIYYAHGYNPTNGWVSLDGSVKMAEIPGETFYDRTVPISGLKVVEEYVTIVIPYTSTGFYYVVDSTPTLAEDWTLAAYEPGNGGTLAIKVKSAGNSGFYRVRITDVEPESDESPED